jgi:hypothetical protein
MLLAGEAITRDAYRQLSEAMFGAYPMPEGDAPEGLIVHTAGESDQGWYVYDVWESKEHFQRFVESKLGPAMEASGGEAAGGQLEPQFFPVEVLVKGPAL